MSTHARLSPSSSKRWMSCPGSIKLIEDNGLKDSPNQFSKEGTYAHFLAETCLIESTHPSEYVGKTLVDDVDTFVVTEEMAAAVAEYYDYVIDILDFNSAQLSVEVACSLKKLNIPGLDGGTSDAVLRSTAFKYLEIVDYKHGSGVLVDADNNTQLMCYALGALLNEFEFDNIPDDIDVTLTIVQPRCARSASSVSSWVIFSRDLKSWAKNELIPSAQKIADGCSDLSPTEEGCRWCLAKGCCPKLYEITNSLAVADFNDDLELISSVQKIEILNNSKLISQFLKNVSDQVFNEIASGSNEYDGHFKLVRANTQSRLIDDAFDPISSPLLDYVVEDDLYERKPKGIGAIEATLKEVLKRDGIKGFTKIAKEIMDSVKYKPVGELSLAPYSDKRPQESPGVVSDFEMCDSN